MTLQELWNDHESLPLVKKFLIDFLADAGVKRMFAGQDVAHVGEARDIIEKAFDELDNILGPKKKKKEIKNQSR